MASELREITNIIAQIFKAYAESQAESRYKDSSEYVMSRFIKECGIDLDYAIRQLKGMEKFKNDHFDTILATSEYQEMRQILENVNYVLMLLGSFREENIIRLRPEKKSTSRPGGAEFNIE